jgi:hypothetical protein
MVQIWRPMRPPQPEGLPHKIVQQFFVSAHRFTFAARDHVSFPAVAANTLRGALGMARETDEYFSPRHEMGASGFADPPRPFVLRAGSLNNGTFQPGDSFCFDLHLFVLGRHSLAAFTLAISKFADVGLGRSRGRAELKAIDRLARDRTIAQRIWANGEWCAPDDIPITIDLERPADAAAVQRVVVEFLTPTELKHQGGLIDEPSFPIFFARVRDRICALSRFYNGFTLDTPPMEATAHVRTIETSIIHNKAERRSSRTGQRHPLGGFTGTAVYEGELSCFLPWLEAAYWTGVGRQTVWGKGTIRTSVSECEAPPARARAPADE